MKKNQKGQTLVVLLFFVMIGIMVTIAATIILSINSMGATNLANGEISRQEAESGAERALLALLRDPNYSGETFQIGLDSITTTVSGTTTKVINSVATSGNFIRKIEVNASYSNNILVVNSWKEVFN